MFINHMLQSSRGFDCSTLPPATLDPNASSLSTWLGGDTITNGTTVLPRDLTLANTYAANAARWNNPTGGVISQSTLNPYSCSITPQNSVQFTGINSTTKLYSNSHTGLQLAGGNFTIELWVRLGPTISGFAGQRLIDKLTNPGNEYSEFMLWGLDGKQTSSGYAGIQGFWFGASASASTAPFVGGSETSAANYWGTFLLNRWTFLSVTRSGNNWYMHQDGVLRKTLTASGTIFYKTTGGMYVGSWGAQGNATNGNIKDLKIYKGLAKYSTASYMPPRLQNLY